MTEVPHCAALINAAECGAEENLRFFNSGWRCPIHTENAVRGLPEYPEGPGIPVYRSCGNCDHIQKDHVTINLTQPGKCKSCSCQQFERKAD